MRLAIALCLMAGQAFGQGCAASPEAAARAAIGSAGTSSTTGYRVDEVQVDTVLKRVWMRVIRCDDASAPAVLVPVAAPLGSSAAQLPQVASLQAVKASPMVIRGGDPVQAILTTSAVHMTLDATSDQAGAVGDVILLTLKPRTGQPVDEPAHRIRGIVRADKTVEVQP